MTQMKRWVFFILIGLFFSHAAMAENFQLPFSGKWFVMQGGDSINVNHHMTNPSQLYGIDFIKIGGVTQRELFQTDGKSVEDYYSWAQEVLSPAEGVVIDTNNSVLDNPIGQTDASHPAGNYIILETSEKNYIVLAHFKKDSIVVKKGDVVKINQLLGLCGNSGNTSAPHIHMHLQNAPEIFSGTGQNMHFDSLQIAISDKTFAATDWPLMRGMFIEKK